MDKQNHDKKILFFIKLLSGNPDAAPTGEVMVHGKARLISNRAKSNVFSSYYPCVSRFQFNKVERTTNRLVNQMLRGS